MSLTISEALAAHALKTPNKTALVIYTGDNYQAFSFADLLAYSRGFSEYLRGVGCERGDVVFVVFRHSLELYFSFIGALLEGFIPSYLPFATPKQDPDLYWGSHVELFRRTRPKLVLTYPENLEHMQAAALQADVPVFAPEALPHPIYADSPQVGLSASLSDLALLQHSSGTTGLKRGVMLTHSQIKEQVESYANAIGFTGRSRVCSWLPLYHDMGLVTSLLMPLYTGACTVSLDAFEWVARPHRLLELMDRHACDFAWLPNFAFNHIARALPDDVTYDLSQVKAFINCSEPCRPESIERFVSSLRCHGVRENHIQACYAMAETVFAVTQTPPGGIPRTIYVERGALEHHRAVIAERSSDSVALLSTGRAVPGISVRIDAPIGPAEHGLRIGEILLKGEFIFDGYYRNSSATSDAFCDGWYKSGDLGFILDGELYVCGRKKDLMIIHGRNFYSHDIEAFVNTIDGIHPGRVVALGIFDSVSGTEEAYVIAESEITDAGSRRALSRQVKEKVFSKFELMLKSVNILEKGTLVKTTSGKISRKDNARLVGLGDR